MIHDIAVFVLGFGLGGMLTATIISWVIAAHRRMPGPEDREFREEE